MKMSPEFSKAQKNMQPGEITSAGFLGTDSRNIVEIIEADEERASALGLDFDEFVPVLRRLMEEGRKGLGEPVTVEGRWIVTAYEARGHLASPFEDGVFRKVNAKIVRTENGKPTPDAVLVSDLSLHLMAKYHFLQGRGSAFRLEPDLIQATLA